MLDIQLQTHTAFQDILLRRAAEVDLHPPRPRVSQSDQLKGEVDDVRVCLLRQSLQGVLGLSQVYLLGSLIARTILPGRMRKTAMSCWRYCSRRGTQQQAPQR